MVKISKNLLTHLVFATTQALRYGLAGAVSIENTTMASNMILDTSHSAQQVKKMV